MSDDQFQVLQTVDWGPLLVKLNAYATVLVNRNNGWRRGPSRLPSGDEAEDKVQEAIKRLFDGTRKWDQTACPSLEAFLKGVIKSLLSSDVKSQENQLNSKENSSEPTSKVISIQDRVVSIEEDIDYKALMAHMAREVQGANDNDLELVFLCISDGISKPEEISEETGIPVSDVYNVQKRIRRLLKSFRNS
jgi:DNA-directed RNA polymerase specialized sigma24 family protein